MKIAVFFEQAIAEYYETEALTIRELVDEMIDQDLTKEEMAEEIFRLLTFLNETFD